MFERYEDKKEFQKADEEVIRFEKNDVIATSDGEETGPDSFGATSFRVQDSGNEF